MRWSDSYYDPPEYPEFEKDLEETVYCRNEECSEFEVEVDKELTFSFSGTYGSATYECQTCKQDSEIEIERDFSEPDPDEAYERMRDEW